MGQSYLAKLLFTGQIVSRSSPRLNIGREEGTISNCPRLKLFGEEMFSIRIASGKKELSQKLPFNRKIVSNKNLRKELSRYKYIWRSDLNSLGKKLSPKKILSGGWVLLLCLRRIFIGKIVQRGMVAGNKCY